MTASPTRRLPSQRLLQWNSRKQRTQQPKELPVLKNNDFGANGQEFSRVA